MSQSPLIKIHWKRKKFRIKPARLADLKSVRKLFSYINHNIKKEEVEEMIDNRKVFVLKDGKKRIKAAFAYNIYTVAGLFTIMYIKKLSVHPTLKGKGIGRFLLEHIKEEGVKIGATLLFLYSVKQAYGFYKKSQMKNLWRFFWWKNKKNV